MLNVGFTLKSGGGKVNEGTHRKSKRLNNQLMSPRGVREGGGAVELTEETYTCIYSEFT